MPGPSVENAQKKKNKKRKGSKLISFDDEIITKSTADEILAQEYARNAQQVQKNQNTTSSQISEKSKKRKKKSELSESETNLLNNEADNDNKDISENPELNEPGNEDKKEEAMTNKKVKKKKKKETIVDHDDVQNNEVTDKSNVKKKRKKNSLQVSEPQENAEESAASGTSKKTESIRARKREKHAQADHDNVQNNEEVTDESNVKKKRKKNSLQVSEPQEHTEESAANGTSKKTESIRAQKREKHAQLMQERKSEAELGLQQKALNYLSGWKHNRDEWKFEKLRQIWLLQNMYNADKVPQEFWESLVEYFSNAKGKSKDFVLKKALKIIEDENAVEEAENGVEAERARDIIQNLQE